MARILVVEDEPEFGAMLERMLRRRGHAVRLTQRGRDVTEGAAAAGFDLLLTDIFMPDIEGLELIRWVRRNHPGLKVIAMSGGTVLLPGFDPLHNAQAFGADWALAKPFEPEALDAALDALLGAGVPAPVPRPAQGGDAVGALHITS